MDCLVFASMFSILCGALPVEVADRWWPVQAEPAGVAIASDYARYPEVVTASGVRIPGINGPYHMLVQSVSGLAAQAVNEGRCDEMVWAAMDANRDYRDWFERMLGRGKYEVRGVFDPWDLVRRFADKGVVQGYVLYRYDTSKGEVTQPRADIDESVNVATTIAGLVGGVLVSEELEAQAAALGLERLFDARGKTESWCFDTYKDRLNRRMACFQDPKAPHCRDVAIAYKAIMLFENAAPAEAVMEWLEALSPIVGWPGGDEFEGTLLSTVYGHFQTATNWCINLPLLMAGSERRTPRAVRKFAPSAIDFEDRRRCTAFVMSDGDNVQWYMGGFLRAQDGWWNSVDRGRFPFGWSCPLAHLAQLCTEAADYSAETQSAHCWMIEWGGGYYYPDLFASKRADRWGLLDAHARRTWRFMRATGTDVIGFNVSDIDSPDAMRAYRTIVNAMDGLLGILAFQYAPYEGGEGQVFWIPSPHGDVPVVCARASIWSNTDRPYSGTPAKIARLLNADQIQYSWNVMHSWSYFRKSSGAGDHDEDLPQDHAVQEGGVRGLTPVGWCVERLDAGVHVVSPQELLWRLRMEHDPEATQKAIAR